MSEPRLPLNIEHTCWRVATVKGYWFEIVPGIESERTCPACQYIRGWQDAQKVEAKR